MRNMHPYFSLNSLGKKYSLYTAKYGTISLPDLLHPSTHPFLPHLFNIVIWLVINDIKTFPVPYSLST